MNFYTQIMYEFELLIGNATLVKMKHVDEYEQMYYSCLACDLFSS